ncbi:MAG: hypothetical protein IPP91_17590 [Betaproteobacteria bacterium]|nr:hypothetical protein [Betaproteobacteria bacterium]
MTILAGDVKLVASQVMDDVATGGGAPTATVIADGVSNSIFNDISELDRAGGRVNLRKVFASVQTPTRDGYYGANVIVADPPDDPRVSITIFKTGEVFDRRTDAANRVEAYLNKGSAWGGYLFENHITGQRAIQLLQREGAPLPSVGKTLHLALNEGLGSEVSQYVRVTRVSSEVRTFTYSNGSTYVDYQAAVVTCEISDALRYDFAGSAPSRLFLAETGKTKVRDTLVANAAKYYGAVPTTTSVAIGDVVANVATVFSQIVPSAQTETPLVDVRSNGLSVALTASGTPVTLALTLAFTTSNRLFIGGGILPGSLTVTRSGVTLTDAAGVLMNGSSQVGTVDYEGGILSLTVNVFGASGGSHAIVYNPADIPPLISDSFGVNVTIETRSISYAITLPSVPARASLSVSYLSGGRWYVLREGGNGVLAGADTSYGVGTLSFATGSLALTLGALPDVGSAIVFQYFTQNSTGSVSNTDLYNGGKLYVPINTSGELTEAPGETRIRAGAATVSWLYGAVTKTATDNGLGILTGDATGFVNYTKGVVYVSPNVLPASGTTFMLNSTGAAPVTAASVAIGGGFIGETNIRPGTVSFTLAAQINYSTIYPFSDLRIDPAFKARSVAVTDNGSGSLLIEDDVHGRGTIGTINYATGQVNVSASGSLATSDMQGPAIITTHPIGGFSSTYLWNGSPIGGAGVGDLRVRSLTAAPQNVAVSYLVAAGGAGSVSVAVSEYQAKTIMTSDFTLRGVSFRVGANRYIEQTDGTISKNPDPITGIGTPCGVVNGALGTLSITSWTTGDAPTIADWAAIQAPPTAGLSAPFMNSAVMFRTSAAPIRPSSLSVLGTLQDGTTFNVTADATGRFNATRVKGRVDYEYGTVQLYFVNPSASAALNIDLAFLGISGLTTIPADLCRISTLRYNAVAYSYLPLDASVLGIDPVRLPTDGRVPIFRPGDFAVLGDTATLAPATVSNGQTVNCGRVRLSRVRVIGSDGAVISTGYAADLEAGTVTFSAVAGYSQPVTVEHRIEDMAQISDVQINGQLSFTRQITHAYPIGSLVSSALISGDMKAYVSVQFDQATWDSSYVDSRVGSTATGTYNDVLAPIEVTNVGASTERWSVQFTNTTSFNVIGEHVGVIATGNTSTDLAPVNPATAQPYFTLRALGWGSGWAAGNVLRFNTVGAIFPVWVVRTIQQGPETVTNDSFTVLIRGDVDRP